MAGYAGAGAGLPEVGQPGRGLRHRGVGHDADDRALLFIAMRRSVEGSLAASAAWPAPFLIVDCAFFPVEHAQDRRSGYVP